MILRAVCLLALACVTAWSQTAHAQAYPSKPISIITITLPGATSETLIKTVSERAGEALHQKIIIDPKPGAGGTIAAVAFKLAKPDGYTLFFASSQNISQDPVLRTDLPFDPVKDFQPLTLVANSLSFLFVPGSSPARSIPELIALAKTKPGGLAYASIGTLSDLMSGVIRLGSKVPLESIQYKGGPAVMPDLLTGRIDFFITSLPTAASFLPDGRLRALAAAAPQRSELLPNVPTFTEGGIPLTHSFSWFGLFAPAGTPDAIVRQLHREFLRAVNDTDVRRKLVPTGYLMEASESPEDFVRWIAADRSRIEKLVKELGIKAN